MPTRGTPGRIDAISGCWRTFRWEGGRRGARSVDPVALWLLAGALAVYLGYRAWQGIEWLANRHRRALTRRTWCDRPQHAGKNRATSPIGSAANAPVYTALRGSGRVRAVAQLG